MNGESVQHPSLRVEVTRAHVVERRHEVVAVAVDARRRTVLAHGDRSLVTPTRSTVKLLQALPLLRSGAADAFGITDVELALACASHSGEEQHRGAVHAWLTSIGGDESTLGCPPSLPWLSSVAAEYLTNGGAPTRLAHNCSGKHCGFLTLARHIDAEPAGYLDPAGPVQSLVLDAVAETCGVGRRDLVVGVDGCGAPVPCLDVASIAFGLARAAAAGADAGSAEHRLFEAWERHPALVAGPGRVDTELVLAGAPVLTKLGADGIHVAYVRTLGLGVVVKALDGDRLAAELALLHVLREIDASLVPETPEFAAERVLRNDNLTITGSAAVVTHS